MKKILIAACLLFFAFCSKNNKEPNCVTWVVTYCQGTKDFKTVVTNYYPYDKEINVCGSDKANAVQNKIVVVKQVSDNLYDYYVYSYKKH